MAAIVSSLRVYNAFYLVVDQDPSLVPGTPAGIGSLAITPNGTVYEKTTPPDTGWTLRVTAGGALGPDVEFGTEVSGGLISATGGNGELAFGRAAGGSGVITASGIGSIAFGNASSNAQILANNDGTYAGGAAADSSSITASGPGSFAHGYSQLSISPGVILASNQGSFAFGFSFGNITSGGRGALAFGFSSDGAITASGEGSVAGGHVDNSSNPVTSSGTASFAFGREHAVNADFATAFGIGQQATSFGCLVVGRYGNAGGTNATWIANEPLIAAGNGTSTASPANAWLLSKDGKIVETGAKRVPIREVTGSDSISARTDQNIVFNSVAGGPYNLSLPPGETGLEFTFIKNQANTQSFALVPSGGDVLDSTIPPNLNFVNNLTIIYLGNTWFTK